MNLDMFSHKLTSFVDKGFNTHPIAYRFFTSEEMGTEYPVCVFTLVEKLQDTSTIMQASEIMEAICKAEGLNGTELEFFDFCTHLDSGPPCGYFAFQRLKVKKLESSHLDPCLWVEKWIDLACPHVVFQAFGHLVGKFRTFEELNPAGSHSYANIEEYEAARDWDTDLHKQVKIWHAEGYTIPEVTIYTPEQATELTYVFSPGNPRSHTVEYLLKQREANWPCVVVDLSNSYLLRQVDYRFDDGLYREREPPKCFSLWYS